MYHFAALKFYKITPMTRPIIFEQFETYGGDAIVVGCKKFGMSAAKWPRTLAQTLRKHKCCRCKVRVRVAGRV